MTENQNKKEKTPGTEEQALHGPARGDGKKAPQEEIKAPEAAQPPTPNGINNGENNNANTGKAAGAAVGNGGGAAAAALPFTAPGSVYAPYAPATLSAPSAHYPPQPGARPKEPYTATGADALFALAYLLMGVWFYEFLARCYEFGMQGAKVPITCVVYTGIFLLYAYIKHIRPTIESWYWLGIILLTGFSCWLYPSGALFGTRALFLFAAVIYWSGSLFGVLLEKRTGNLLVADGVNLLLLIPFRNFGLMVRSVKDWIMRGRKGPKDPEAPAKAKRVGAVLLGVAICIPILAILLPMLVEADGGGFEGMLLGIGTFFSNFFYNFFKELKPLRLIVGFLIGCYLFGLAAGGGHKRYVKNIDEKNLRKGLEHGRILPKATVAAVLVGVTVVYILFIGFQIPYFFSAFQGVMPQGYTNYADYARAGFFELCRIASINLGLLLAANCLCGVKRSESRLLRSLNILLSGVTLLLLVTAFSKMAMYIGVYGLTPKRILTSIFMVFLAGVWGGVIVLQYRAFSIVRFAAVLGSAMFCALCLSNMNHIVISTNARLYQENKIPVFETVLLYNDGYGYGLGDFDTALSLYIHVGESLPESAENRSERTEVEILYESLERNMKQMIREAYKAKNTTYETLTYAHVRQVDLTNYPALHEEAKRYIPEGDT